MGLFSNILVLVCLQMLATGFAYGQVVVYALNIPGLYQSNQQGAYDKILAELNTSEFPFTVSTVPPARADARFKSCDSCCYTPANKNPEFYDFPESYVETAALNTAKAYGFTLTNAPKIKEINDLAG